MTGKEFLEIMNEYEFKEKPYWESELIAMLPEEQVDRTFLMKVMDIFQKQERTIYIYKMLDFLKYDKVFEEYKKDNPDLGNHNILTYITSLMLQHEHKTRRYFGIDFCVDCIS